MMIGEIISHYKIIKKIGEGSSGVVYKAEDTRLGRFVALKFLPSDLRADEEKKMRFLREAMTASALDHANICTVHDIEETKDGRLFICMALYEGETLTEKMKKGPLKVGEVIDIALQVAEGMEKAHGKGIVHRDIKPQNLILTNEGVVKIVDFGLAKLIGQKDLTREGITVGTVGYMSPEQARGDVVDQKTDIWSLGVVIYEMITGQLPFKGENAQAVIYSILNNEPKPITNFSTNIPPELERIVNKCLSKESSKRCQHLDELIVELRRLKEKMNRTAIPSIKAVSKRTVLKQSLRYIVLTILTAAIIIIGGYFFFDKVKPPGISKEKSLTAEVKPSIAVLPFKDISPDHKQEYFCDGMVEELIIALTRVQGLQVVPRTSSFQFKGKNIDAREIGKQFNVKTVLEGSVRIAGNTVIITTKLINISDGCLLWGEKYQGKLEDIFTVQENIAREIVNALALKLGEGHRVPLIRRYTGNIEAYNLYLKGRYFWSRRMPEDLVKGIKFFREAIEIDPNYALAYVGVSDSYNLLASYGVLPPQQAFPKAKEAALKALEIDNTLGEAHTSLAAVKFFYEWDWPAAEREFKRAIELNPYYNTAHEWYADYLAATNKIEESIAEMKRAVEFEPLSVSSQTGIGRHLYYAKKFDEAIKYFHRALELDPYCFYAHAHLGQTYIMKSKYPEAITHFEQAVAITGGKEAGSLCGLGYAYGISGKKEAALKILEKLRSLANHMYVRPTYFAGIYIGLGDNDKAFQWLDKAYQDRCDWLIQLQNEHMFNPIRKDPRFGELVKKVGLEYNSNLIKKNN
jgi:serine/threonine protein kinase/tetratricopeptide (TPR) repeat protein